ncbi:unnamed protein product [Paramecium sonneborni]|uniref:Uncharacterized protein n=1 Tax=Paramecium sonneborni TaxID=65129 RepID=A0A8S1K5P3_9CILI|nr:unnamed protein product [Paramecium sonneborni]
MDHHKDDFRIKESVSFQKIGSYDQSQKGEKFFQENLENESYITQLKYQLENTQNQYELLINQFLIYKKKTEDLLQNCMEIPQIELDQNKNLKVEALQIQINLQNNELRELKEENLRLQEQLKSKKEQLDDTNKLLNHTKEQLDDTIIQLNITKEQLDNSNRQLNDIKEQLDNSNKQLNYTKEQLDNSNKQQKITMQQVDDLNKQLNDIIEQSSDKNKLLNYTKEQLDDTIIQLNITKEQLDNSNKQQKITIQQVDDLNKQLNDIIEQFNDKNKLLNYTKEQLDDTVIQLNIAKQQLNDNKEQLNGTKQQLNDSDKFFNERIVQNLKDITKIIIQELDCINRQYHTEDQQLELRKKYAKSLLKLFNENLRIPLLENDITFRHDFNDNRIRGQDEIYKKQQK